MIVFLILFDSWVFLLVGVFEKHVGFYSLPPNQRHLFSLNFLLDKQCLILLFGLLQMCHSLL